MHPCDGQRPVPAPEVLDLTEHFGGIRVGVQFFHELTPIRVVQNEREVTHFLRRICPRFEMPTRNFAWVRPMHGRGSDGYEIVLVYSTILLYGNPPPAPICIRFSKETEAQVPG